MHPDTIWRDGQFAIRGFRRQPAAALAVVATLAVALGLNAAAFSVFNAYVFRPAAVRDADSLHSFSWADRTSRPYWFTWQEYEELRRDTTGVFSEILAERMLLARINDQPLFGVLVTGNYFSMLGVPAALGRVLAPADATASKREQVVVLSHATWMRTFGGDPAIVGKRVTIWGVQMEVVGVAAERFGGLDLLPYDFWAPLTLSPLVEDGADLFGAERPRRLQITGRLRPSHTLDSAKAALLAWAQRMTADGPPEARAIRPILLPAATPIPLTFEVALVFAPVAVAFALVLLTAAANIAGLMLSRATVRQREIAIRMSLGATRGHIVRQFLTESLLLAALAAIAGFAVALLTLDVGVRLVLATLPGGIADYIRLMPLPPDMRVFGFMLAAAVATAFLFGVAPALQATRGTQTITTHGATPDTRSSRLRYGLVIAQITASALLVVTSGVLLKGAAGLSSVDLGMRVRDVIEMRVRARSTATVLATLQSSAVVRNVALTSHSAFSGGAALRVAPADGAAPVEQGMRHRYASPEYFTVFDIPIVSGRPFTDAEARGEIPVVIISQRAAERLWPRQNAVGRVVRLGPDPAAREEGRRLRFRTAEVIGVAREVATSVDPADRAIVYLPTATNSGNRDGEVRPVIVVRTTGDVNNARRQIDAALAAAAPGAVEQIIAIDDLAAGRLYPLRAAYWLAGGIGVLALLLTVSGVYGVLSYAVARRTKEIGIRMALGASSHSIIGLVLRQSLRMCAIGLALGTSLAFGTSKLLSSVLVMIDSFDALAFASGIAVVLTACMAAAFYPARRAARIEPLTALRIE